MPNQIINTLSQKIYENPVFREDYELLVKNELTLSKFEGKAISQNQIKRLLESAAILSMSNDQKHQKLAFKIAVFLLKIFKEEYVTLPYVVELILTRLGDLPTIHHVSAEKGSKDYFSFFGDDQDVYFYAHFPEVVTRKIINQFELKSGNILSMTNFQSDIFQHLIDIKNVAFSAPTSAGKSFVVHNYVVHQLLNSENYTAVYVVPTKSLITESQESLRKLTFENGINPNNVAIVNSAEHLDNSQFENIGKRVLILTQERLQFLLTHHSNIQVDLLIVDEAQKIKENERGVVLEDAIDDLVKSNPKMQCVFISPNSENLTKFGTIFGLDVLPIATSKTPVGQNIFYINIKRGNMATVSLLSEEFNRELIEIEKFPIESKVPTSKFGIKSWVVNNMVKGTGFTIIYCDRPKECRDIADEISYERNDFEKTKELDEAIDFLSTHVHEQYYLVDHLKYGVGYHYGKMPQFVRFLVKELFDNKQIDFLCCTSTLLEEVNLPAKNIVLYKPKSGYQNAMDKYTIKNLAGRAGRLGKDYYGNVYCIDIDDWEDGKDAFDDELEIIQSSIEKTISLDSNDLIQHLKNYQLLEHGKKGIGVVATSLIVKQLKNPNKDFLKDLQQKYNIQSEEIIDEIRVLLKKISEEIAPLPTELISRNSSIDPRLQYRLYQYLRKRGNLVLPPEPDFEFFKDDLKKIFRILQNIIFNDTLTERYSFYTAIADEWINQHSYKSIVEASIRFQRNVKLKREPTKEEINSIIDEMDAVIEEILKYDYARALRCYCDIADFIMKKKDSLEPYSMKLPDYLETGAHDERVFLLLNLGISRNNAISISREMPRKMDEKQCISWMKKNIELVKTKLHPVMYSELDRILMLI